MQWGLRGDPLFWRELAAYFASTPLPASEAMLVALLHETFERRTGAPMDHHELSIPVARCPTQGMSDGRVSPALGRDTAIPILGSRYQLRATTET